MGLINLGRKKNKNKAYHWRQINSFIKKHIAPFDKDKQRAIRVELNIIQKIDRGPNFPVRYVSKLFRVFPSVNNENNDLFSLHGLLNRWLTIFVNSEEFGIICKRSDATQSKVVQRLGLESIRVLFIFWSQEKYPALFNLLINQLEPQEAHALFQLKFKTFLSFAPFFIIFNIANHLSSRVYITWVKWLGEGYNMRKAPDLPFPLTKKMAHLMMQAPKKSSFNRAFLYGQVMALGGSHNLFELFHSHYGNRFRNHEFRSSVIHFFTKYENQLNNDLSRQLLGYIDHMFMETTDFSMKGRTLSALLRQSEHYYQHLQMQPPQWEEDNDDWISLPKGTNLSKWDSVLFPSFITREGTNTFRIQQLNTFKDLTDEGAAMSHCVASYAKKCIVGACSIWSLREFNPANKRDDALISPKMKRLVTIQLDPQGRIIQARRKYNALPKPEEEKLIIDWAEESGLQVVGF